MDTRIKETPVSLLIDKVLLENTIIYKDSGLWAYFENEDFFFKGSSMLDQKVNETFESFIRRVIQYLLEGELRELEIDPEPGLEFSIIEFNLSDAYSIFMRTNDPQKKV